MLTLDYTLTSKNEEVLQEMGNNKDMDGLERIRNAIGRAETLYYPRHVENRIEIGGNHIARPDRDCFDDLISLAESEQLRQQRREKINTPPAHAWRHRRGTLRSRP